MRAAFHRSGLLVAVAFGTASSLAACGSDESAANAPGGYKADASTEGKPSDGAAGDGAKLDALLMDYSAGDGSGCKTAEACGDGGICAGGTCCQAELACGET